MRLHSDVITGQPRLIAPSRAWRLGGRPEGCPFCVGNEQQTPPELERIPAANGGWHARAVPNLFPLARAHEVLVMAPRHVTTVRDLTVDEWEQALLLWLRRLTAHSTHAAHDYAHLFVNDGHAAGASLEHSHAQLVVLPRSAGGDTLTARVRGDACTACGLREREPKLVVWSRHVVDGHVDLVASPTPRAGGSLLLLPREHRTTVEPSFAADLARCLHAAVVALVEGPFNLWLVIDTHHAAHWYVELVPRNSTAAGVELALGVGVAITDPVTAAAAARERLGATPAQ